MSSSGLLDQLLQIDVVGDEANTHPHRLSHIVFNTCQNFLVSAARRLFTFFIYYGGVGFSHIFRYLLNLSYQFTEEINIVTFKCLIRIIAEVLS